jgi:hypothetical protein
VGAEANNAASFVKGVAHGEVFAAVGIVPPLRYRLLLRRMLTL